MFFLDIEAFRFHPEEILSMFRDGASVQASRTTLQQSLLSALRSARRAASEVEPPSFSKFSTPL
jgi:hypothetical protein